MEITFGPKSFEKDYSEYDEILEQQSLPTSTALFENLNKNIVIRYVGKNGKLDRRFAYFLQDYNETTPEYRTKSDTHNLLKDEELTAENSESGSMNSADQLDLSKLSVTEALTAVQDRYGHDKVCESYWKLNRGLNVAMANKLLAEQTERLLPNEDELEFFDAKGNEIYPSEGLIRVSIKEVNDGEVFVVNQLQ